MNVVDLGLQRERDTDGRYFEAYVMEVNAPCRHCGEVFTGRSVTGRDLLLALDPQGTARLRMGADADFLGSFCAEFQRHERRHYFRRAVKWVRRLFA